MNTQLYDDILKELELDPATDLDNIDMAEAEKQASADMTDPLAIEITSFLREVDEIDKISSVSQAIDVIEKVAGEEVFDDKFRDFIARAEVAGYTYDEITDFLDKEAGIVGKMKNLLVGNRQLSNLRNEATRALNISSNLKGVGLREAQNALIGHGKALNNIEPGLFSRFKGAFTKTNPYESAKKVAESNAVQAIKELNVALPAGSKIAPSDLQDFFGGYKARNSQLKAMMKLPKKDVAKQIPVTADMTGTQIQAIKAANLLERLNKSKHRNAVLASGAGGVAAARLLGGDSGGGNDGKKVIVA